MKQFDVYHPTDYCEFCGKEFCVQNIERHTAVCPQNPKIVQLKKDLVFTCDYCGKSYSALESNSERFCSKKCSRSFSSSFVNSKTVKEALCSVCGKPFEIKLNASAKTCKCAACKKPKKPRGFKKAPEKRRTCCKYCSKEITNAGALALHERSCAANPNAQKRSYNYKRKDIRTGYIYLIKNKVNNKIYIGKKAGDANKSESYLGSGIAIKRAITKYGKNSFEKTILEEVKEGDLNARERYWIKKYQSNTSSVGYNLSEGGDGGPLFKGHHHTKDHGISPHS